jgi:hypothetical protein
LSSGCSLGAAALRRGRLPFLQAWLEITESVWGPEPAQRVSVGDNRPSSDRRSDDSSVRIGPTALLPSLSAPSRRTSAPVVADELGMSIRLRPQLPPQMAAGVADLGFTPTKGSLIR